MPDCLPIQDLVSLSMILKRREVWENRNLLITLTSHLSDYLEKCVIEPYDSPDRLSVEVEYLQYLKRLVDTVLYEGIHSTIDSVYEGKVFTIVMRNLDRLRDLLLEEEAVRLDRKQTA